MHTVFIPDPVETLIEDMAAARLIFEVAQEALLAGGIVPDGYPRFFMAMCEVLK